MRCHPERSAAQSKDLHFAMLCHPERSAAESKDLRFLSPRAVVLHGGSRSLQAPESRNKISAGFSPGRKLVRHSREALGLARSVRARLQSCRKSSKMTPGFSTREGLGQKVVKNALLAQILFILAKNPLPDHASHRDGFVQGQCPVLRPHSIGPLLDLYLLLLPGHIRNRYRGNTSTMHVLAPSL